MSVPAPPVLRLIQRAAEEMDTTRRFVEETEGADDLESNRLRRIAEIERLRYASSQH